MTSHRATVSAFAPAPAGRARRALDRLVLAPRWEARSPASVGLTGLCLLVAAAPGVLGEDAAEAAHLVLIVLLGLVGARMSFGLGLAVALVSEAVLAAQRVAWALDAGDGGGAAMAVAWTVLGPLAVVGAHELSEAPRRRVRVAADAAVHSIVRALATKDAAVGDHSDSVGVMAVAVGRRLGVPEAELPDLEVAACLHDLGKLAIPQHVLDKPGPLDDEERALVRRHPEIGAEMVAEIPSLAHLAPVLRAMHERWDGAGYPDDLAGARIPLAARIVFVCDAFEAITGDRPYDAARTHAEAVRELETAAGTQFDPAVVRAFVAEMRGRGVADGPLVA